MDKDKNPHSNNLTISINDTATTPEGILIFGLGMIFSFTAFYMACVTQVRDGHLGVETNMITGKVTNDETAYKPDWYVVGPLTSYREIHNPEVNSQAEIKGQTKDGKLVLFDFSANYKMKNKMAIRYYKEFHKYSDRVFWGDVVVVPVIQETMQEVIRKTNHSEIITDEIGFTQKVQKAIAKNLEKEGIELKQFVLPYIQEHGTRKENYIIVDRSSGVKVQNTATTNTQPAGPIRIHTQLVPGNKFNTHQRSN